MTFIEIMLVVSLIGLVSLALYQSFTNGLRVWQKSRELIIEEDVAVFFDKLAQDLRNTYVHTTQYFEGDSSRVSFPALVWLKTMNPRRHSDEYSDQMGQVEYALDVERRSIVRRSANYSEARQRLFGQEQVVVTPIDGLQFKYYYLTDDGEIFSEQVLETVPAGIEVEVTIQDSKGRRSLKRYFNIPLKI
jgi:Tfp pilus assembly protein PilE